MDEKENELALALVTHINDTFTVINKMKNESDFKRDNVCDTNQMFLRENLYSSYLQSIYYDAFLLLNISDHFGVFVQTIMDLYNREKNDINNELGNIISRLNDEFINLELNGSTATITCSITKLI